MERVIMDALRAHDLVRLAPSAPAFDNAPPWVARSLKRAPFVVVRRASAQNGRVAVGVRGATRSERFGTWLDARAIRAAFRPEDLSWASIQSTLPAFALLRRIEPVCNASGMRWGPAGSVGFELVSDVRTVTASSDLDVVLRSPQPLDRDAARALIDELTQRAARLNTRIDAQIETPNGAFSLAEFAHGGTRVMLRSADGPTLVTDPWRILNRAA